jgi:hypothetical protein
MRRRSGTNRISGIPSGGGKITVYPDRRVCADDGCATVLSVYNAKTLCSVHEPLPRPSRGARPAAS